MISRLLRRLRQLRCDHQFEPNGSVGVCSDCLDGFEMQCVLCGVRDIFCCNCVCPRDCEMCT